MKVIFCSFPYSGGAPVISLLKNAFGLEPRYLQGEPDPGYAEPLEIEDGQLVYTHKFTANDALEFAGDAKVIVCNRDFVDAFITMIMRDRYSTMPERPMFTHNMQRATDQSYVNLWINAHPKQFEIYYRQWLMFTHKIYSARSINTNYGAVVNHPKKFLIDVIRKFKFTAVRPLDEVLELYEKDMKNLEEVVGLPRLDAFSAQQLSAIEKKLTNIKTYNKL